MNIFKENSFLGTFSLESLKEADQKFWMIAKEVDEALGDRKYLLNVYLSNILEVINSTQIYTAASEGFNDCIELLCLCGDVYNETKIARNKNVYYKPQFHEFYPHLKKFINEHPECQSEDKSNKLSIFLWINGLFCEFTEYAIKRFFNKANKNLLACVDTDIIDECYRNIVEITGQNLMEKLNNAIKERFIKVSLLNIYFQSTINQYIDCLTQRDPKTSKFIFRVVLDSMKTKEKTG